LEFDESYNPFWHVNLANHSTLKKTQNASVQMCRSTQKEINSIAILLIGGCCLTIFPDDSGGNPMSSNYQLPDTPGSPGVYIAHAVYGFFLNGGRRCWVVDIGSKEPHDKPLTAALDVFAAINDIAILAAPRLYQRC
jgi:hypothetical protein